MDKKTKATLAWEAILAILAIKKGADYGCELLDRQIALYVPKPHVTAVQFIMIGSGVATNELIPDGEWGKQSFKSLSNLYWTTQGS